MSAATNTQMYPTIALVFMLLICVATDLWKRMIYNVVVFPGIAAALLLRAGIEGICGIAHGLFGFAVGLALLFIPYWLGGMGAGDVKLLAAVGAFKGASFVLVTAAYMAVIGAALSIIALLCAKGAALRVKTMLYLLAGLRFGVLIPVDYRGTFSGVTFPYALAIAGGALCGVTFDG